MNKYDAVRRIVVFLLGVLSVLSIDVPGKAFASGIGSDVPSDQIRSTYLDALLTNKEAVDPSPRDGHPRFEGNFLDKHDVGGVWWWRMVNAVDNTEWGTQDHGVLIFRDDSSGTIRGTSLAETTYHRDFPLRSMGTMNRFFGKKEVGPEGETTLRFAFPNSHGTKVESYAKLSENGKFLAGVTRVTGVYQGRTIDFHYQWTAERRASK